ncbi:MAG TPA: peptidoglycan-binding protein LysM [Myxococcaceae bacterium]|nr:peptidoglycan-binding protein LysM [Myxococcaceae bacterium]
MSHVLAAALALLTSAATTPVAGETVVRPGESLAQLAARTLGSEGAGAELLAFNHLQATPAAGTRVLVPGPERARAVAAIGSARSAVVQAPAGSARTEAEARLAEAESLLARARYAEAAAQADGAWKLLAEAREERSHFAVAVEPDGRTRVAVREGVPVRVEAQGRARAVRAGETLTVIRGEPPGTPQLESATSAPSAEPPILISPEPGLKLALEPAPGGLGPVRFAWKPVPEATGYVLELAGPRSQSIRTAQPVVTVPGLPAGRYRWTVRAVQPDGTLGPAATRAVQLVPGRIKLEVKETPWQ